MDFWEKVDKKLTDYVNCPDNKNFEELFSCLEDYLSKRATAARYKAEATGVYIPFEDFYSNFRLSTWQAIEDYPTIETSTFKSVLLHRLFFSERAVWQLYKKKSADQTDKDGVTYEGARWSSTDELPETFYNSTEMDEERFYLLEELEKYASVNRTNYNFLRLLIYGFTPKEAVIKLKIADEYDASARKKVQRIRRSFKKFLEENN